MTEIFLSETLCGTCAHWCGPRRPNFEANYVEVISREIEGSCAIGCYGYDQPASACCGNYYERLER